MTFSSRSEMKKTSSCQHRVCKILSEFKKSIKRYGRVHLRFSRSLHNGSFQFGYDNKTKIFTRWQHLNERIGRSRMRCEAVSFSQLLLCDPLHGKPHYVCPCVQCPPHTTLFTNLAVENRKKLNYM